MAARYLITGTDTGVGKTIVAAGIAGALGASYWKPVQAGLDEETDSEAVGRLGGSAIPAIVPETYRFASACSPHEAARRDGASIDPKRLELPSLTGPLIVEGAGGLMVPLNRETLYLHVFERWQLPVILVARTSLGTINHSLLSISALRGRHLEIAGIVFVGAGDVAAEEAIVRLGQVRHLGRLSWLDPLSQSTLTSAVASDLRVDLLR